MRWADDVRTSPVIPTRRVGDVDISRARSHVAPLVKEGLLAALSVCVELPRIWAPDECGLVQETAERTWAVRRAEAAPSRQRAWSNAVLDRRSSRPRTVERGTRVPAREQQIGAVRRLISTQEEGSGASPRHTTRSSVTALPAPRALRCVPAI
jgi:hypothetical protein